MNFGWFKNIRSAFDTSAIILMYHRVAVPAVDPWQLAVNPENFEQQLQVLTKTKSVISLPLLIKRLKNKKLSKKDIALTFDDGYIDNYETVKPLLEKYSVPATFFITTDHVGLKKEYWWDELEKIILQSKELPSHLHLEINGIALSYGLNKETILTEEIKHVHREWAYFKPPTERGDLYLKLWQLISPLTDQEQQQVMEQVRVWACVKEEARPEYCCMTSTQLAEISSGGLIGLGAHTASHPALALHAKQVQQQEIMKCSLFLEKLTGSKINLLAYPSGSFNEDTVDVLKQLRYDAAFTTIPHRVTNKDEPYRLGRFQVNNWGKNKFEEALFEWSRL